MPSAARDAPHRCLVAALALAAFGVFRYAGDILGDVSPGWHGAIEGTWLRYAWRAPSDGTFWGDLNVQWVKVIAVPSGISALYLLYRFLSRDLREADLRWRMPAIRALYVLGLLTACTLMEVEKATHLFGLRMAGLLPGERAWLNHVLHLASAAAGWFYMGWLRLLPDPPPPRRLAGHGARW